MDGLENYCEVCGFIQCACPACWKCGAVGEPSCQDNHRFRGYLAAVEAVIAASGGNILRAARRLGINNTHLYVAHRTRKVSPMLKRALRQNGYIRVRRNRFRLAADFESEAHRLRFIENNLNGKSFTEWVMEHDKLPL